MLGCTLQLQQRGSSSVFDGKCLITHDNPNLAPSGFNLFPHMKWCLGGQYFGIYNELQTSVENWLKAQAAGFYDKGIGKLVLRYEKYPCLSDDYVER